MRRFVAQLNGFLDGKVSPHRGVAGFGDWKFFAVLTLQFAATVLLIRDPWFGAAYFHWEVNTVIFLLALIIVATLAWEELLFGAIRGASLLAQFTMLVPLTLFLTRLLETPSAARDSDSLFGLLRSAFGVINRKIGITEGMPQFLLDLFSNPMLPVIFGVVLLSFCFRKLAVKLGLLLLLFAICFASAAAAPGGDMLWFIPAAATLAGAAALQFCPYRQVVLYCDILRGIEPIRERAAYETALTLLATLARDGGCLSERGLFALVRAGYPAASPEELRSVAGELIGRLTACNLLRLEGDDAGLCFTLHPRLGRTNSLLSGIALWPRMIFMAFFALLWVISPLDLLPDAIPFFGALDDAAVAIMALVQFRKRGDREERANRNP